MSIESLNLLFTELRKIIKLDNFKELKYQNYINEHKHKLKLRYFFDRNSNWGGGLISGIGLHILNPKTETGFFNPANQQRWFHKDCEFCRIIENYNCDSKEGLCDKDGVGVMIMIGGHVSYDRNLFQLRSLKA